MSNNKDDWNSFLDIDELTDDAPGTPGDDFTDVDIEDAADDSWDDMLSGEENAKKSGRAIEAELADEVHPRTRRSRRDDFDFDDDDDDDGEELDEKARPKNKKGSGIVTVLIAIIAILAIIAVAIFAAKLLSKNNTTTGGESESETTSAVKWEQNTNSDILSLVNRYYAARVTGETVTLQEILDPSITLDAAQLANEAEVVEGYQDIACYTTDGKNPGEWVVYITYNLKFKNISTPAPGLIVAYVYTDEAGNLKLIPRENLKTEDEYYQFIAQVADCDFIKQLFDQVQENYMKARRTDSGLDAYLVSMGADPLEDDPSAADTTADPSASSSSESPAESTTAADGDFTSADETMYITKDSVRVRKAPNTNEGTEVITTLSKGTSVKVTGKGSEWYRVKIDGNTGYIKKEFLSTEKPSSSTGSSPTTSASTESFAEADDMMYVTKDSVNVRKAPNTNEGTEVIKSLAKGTKLQVTGKGSEWYRVVLSDGTMGYIKKDFLSPDAPN